VSGKIPADQLMMKIETLRAAGRKSEADVALAELKRDYPKANDPVAEFTLQMMMKHMPGARS